MQLPLLFLRGVSNDTSTIIQTLGWILKTEQLRMTGDL